MKTQLNQIRSFLADGEAESALSALLDLLSDETLPINQRQVYQDQLALVSAQYSAYRKKKSIGTIAGTEANVEEARINERILELANDIAVGRLPSLPQHVIKAKKKQLLFIIGIGLLLVGALVFFLTRETLVCPQFPADAKWKIAVLPFENIGDRNAKPEQVLVTTINELTQKNHVSAKALAWSEGSKGYEKHDVFGHCSMDLLITGQYVLLRSDTVEVSLNYQFAKSGPEIQTEFAAFRNIAALREGIMQNRQLSDAIFSLCALLAVREGNKELTAKWLNKIKKTEAWEEELKISMEKKPD